MSLSLDRERATDLPLIQLRPESLIKPAAEPGMQIIRRNGAVVGFEPSKISIAMTKAFLAVNGGQGAASARVRELVEQLTEGVVSALVRRQPAPRAWVLGDLANPDVVTDLLSLAGVEEKR